MLLRPLLSGEIGDVWVAAAECSEEFSGLGELWELRLARTHACSSLQLGTAGKVDGRGRRQEPALVIWICDVLVVVSDISPENNAGEEVEVTVGMTVSDSVLCDVPGELRVVFLGICGILGEF